EEIEAQPHLRYAIVGVAADAAAPGGLPLRYPLHGPLAHLCKTVEELRPDRIIVAVTERRGGGLPMEALLECRAVRGITIEDGVDVYERLTGKLAIESLTPSKLVFSGGFRRPRLVLGISRGLSVLLSAVGLVCLAPFLGAIALLIRLDSRGPILFVQD